MSRIVDRLAIATLCVVVLALLYEKAQKSEDNGGASPEFVSRIEKQTSDMQKRFDEKIAQKEAISRLGR